MLLESNEDCSVAAFELDLLRSDSSHHVPHDALTEANYTLVKQGIGSCFGPGYATQLEGLAARQGRSFDKDL